MRQWLRHRLLWDRNLLGLGTARRRAPLLLLLLPLDLLRFALSLQLLLPELLFARLLLSLL